MSQTNIETTILRMYVMRIKNADAAPRNSPRKTSLKRLRIDGDEEEDNADEESNIASLKSSFKTPTSSGRKAKRKPSL
ncbi:hypothetical protein SeMB42_g04220 [Synchytrium endobioticum]|uniref:Uncharacterized protein n=1 Tax=Synchytrium endobioticum TaxID=286115 RepID=A0A507CZZ3_9FUNG|nr:hypothetical protein SeMB42_g04220 [Synchytrium endobioticum]